MDRRNFSMEELQSFAGKNQEVLCNAGGLTYRGKIRSHISTSLPPDRHDRFSFSGTAVDRPAQSITWEGREGDFFVLA